MNKTKTNIGAMVILAFMFFIFGCVYIQVHCNPYIGMSKYRLQSLRLHTCFYTSCRKGMP